MEAVIGEEIKFFDDTAAFIYSSVSSIYPSGLTKEPCETDSKAWFVKTEATSPVRDTTDVDQDSGGLQLECEPSLKMLIKTEVTSPAKKHVEECSISPPVLPKESCKEDHKDLLIKTEPASPERYSSDVDQNPGQVNEQTTGRYWGLQCSNPPPSELQSDHHILEDSVHKKIHVFQCALCGHKFSRKLSLKMHVDSVHMKIRPFQCSLCEYKTSQNGNLKTHIDSIHKKIKAFQCNHCEFKCSQNNHLKIHINSVHKKIREFQCTLCENKFSQKCGLNIHIDSVHKKIKAFQCPYCKFKTSRKSILKNHIHSIHKIKVFTL